MALELQKHPKKSVSLQLQLFKNSGGIPFNSASLFGYTRVNLGEDVRHLHDPWQPSATPQAAEPCNRKWYKGQRGIMCVGAEEKE
ncbi:hypothetical protein E2C01_001869 [Portunus trituberculatus]|uniref:Uncharacterized protein n=1 Tax=Portunus trituberculatus TaxID=210409 RepID=A0A5B7CJ11_PORTR|nr:hypothetical protein [Portunus trituberculatus]